MPRYFEVNPDGKAPKGLSVGDKVVTAGGTFTIDGVNGDSYSSHIAGNDKLITTKNFAGTYAGNRVQTGNKYGGFTGESVNDMYSGLIRKVNSGIDKSTGLLVNQLDSQKKGINRAYDASARNAYANYMINNRNLDSQLIRNGLSESGMSESSKVAANAAYGANLTENENARYAAINDVDGKIADARLAGEQQKLAAEQNIGMARIGHAGELEKMAINQGYTESNMATQHNNNKEITEIQHSNNKEMTEIQYSNNKEMAEIQQGYTKENMESQQKHETNLAKMNRPVLSSSSRGATEKNNSYTPSVNYNRVLNTASKKSGKAAVDYLNRMVDNGTITQDDALQMYTVDLDLAPPTSYDEFVARSNKTILTPEVFSRWKMGYSSYEEYLEAEWWNYLK